MHSASRIWFLLLENQKFACECGFFNKFSVKTEQMKTEYIFFRLLFLIKYVTFANFGSLGIEYKNNKMTSFAIDSSFELVFFLNHLEQQKDVDC